jgi:hypothetical protein
LNNTFETQGLAVAHLTEVLRYRQGYRDRVGVLGLLAQGAQSGAEAMLLEGHGVQAVGDAANLIGEADRALLKILDTAFQGIVGLPG